MEFSQNRFREKFIEETGNLLDAAERDLLTLENNWEDKELIESVFRVIHTIKGASSMFGFDFISEFTHNLENIYQQIRDETLCLTFEISELTLQAVDHLRKLLEDPNLSVNKNLHDHHRLLDQINGIAEIKNISSSDLVKSVEKNKEGMAFTWHILLRTSESIYFRGINLTGIFYELSLLGRFEISKIDNFSFDNNDIWSIFLYSEATEQELREVFLFIEDECTIVKITDKNVLANESDDVTHQTNVSNTQISILDYIGKNNAPVNNSEPAPEKEMSQVIQEKVSHKRIAVDSAKLDHLMFLVSELITVNSQINLSARGRQFDNLRPLLEKLDSLSKYFRNNALDIRLVPLSDTVLRFQRLIRDLSKQLQKKVNFLTRGINTELDKSTIDQLSDPLMHIIRNCIDHGIENPEERLKKGKSDTGTITMNAYNSGNNIFITISDDGRGIDTEKVKQKAIDKGLLKPTDNPSNLELYNFIFLPGFSTAKSLTEVSGRGVGMDVVKKRIHEIRGEVFVESEIGIGTTFTLKLEQSMSIIDSLLFKVDDYYFTVPISEIAICIQINPEDIANQTSTLPFQNHLIPFIDLSKLLNLGENYQHCLKAVIIHDHEREIALLCDKIIGEHQAVLKPLGKSFNNQKYITAASQMGDGGMAFMIDTNTLFKMHSV